MLLPFLHDLLKGSLQPGPQSQDYPQTAWVQANTIWDLIVSALMERPGGFERLQEIAARSVDSRASYVLSWEIESVLERIELADLQSLLQVASLASDHIYKQTDSGQAKEIEPTGRYEESTNHIWPGETAYLQEDIQEPVYRGWSDEEITPAYDPQPLATLSVDNSEIDKSEIIYRSADSNQDETEERFLKVEFTDGDATKPLPLKKEFTLAFYVDIEAPDEFSRGQRFADERLFEAGETVARLQVHAYSQDFKIYTRHPQELRIPKTGNSRNKARFELEPLHAGVGELTALFYKDRNFVQGMVVRLNVESGEQAFAGNPENLGRPLEHLSALQPRDILLFIKPGVDGYDLTLVGAQVSQARLPIKPLELNKRIDYARKELVNVVWLAQKPDGLEPLSEIERRKPPRNTPLPLQQDFDLSASKMQPITQKAIQLLANAGWLLYHDLFLSPNAGPDARQIGAQLRQLAQDRELKLQIVSEDFLLPWGLLYMAEFVDPEDIQTERFLGFRHIIEHIPLQTSMRNLQPEISSQPKLTASLNINTDIGQIADRPVIQEQIDYWQKLDNDGVANVILRTSAQEVLNALSPPVDAPEHILYFYGHANSEDLDEHGGPDTSGLTFNDDEKLTMRDLILRAPTSFQLPNSPLVFINACESAQLSPLFYGGFMPYFTAKGARGMIGTECEVPAVFAAEWARRFFERFLFHEEPIGMIFRDLRREFFYRYGNPLGLLYALYCDGDTCVVPGLGFG